MKIFEYDERFAAFGDDFIQYDYSNAVEDDYLDEYSEYFDLIIADPPFLSEECIEKVSNLIKRFSKPNSKVIFCSGEVVQIYVEKFLNLKRNTYEPKHHRNLGNVFASFSNFNLDEYI